MGHALVGAHVGRREPVDLELDDAVPAVVAGEPLALSNTHKIELFNVYRGVI